MPTGCWATTPKRSLDAPTPSSEPGRSTTPTASPWRSRTRPYQLRADRDSLLRAAIELPELCRRHDFAYYGEWAIVLDGWASGGELGVAQIRLGITRLRSQGAHTRMPSWLSLLAEALIGDGHEEEGCGVLDAARVTAEQRDDRWWLPEVMRLRAQLEPGPSGLDLLHRAIDLAGEQSSRTLESRCRADLAGRSVRPSFARPIHVANGERTLPS
jgi:hypothetical protein